MQRHVPISILLLSVLTGAVAVAAANVVVKDDLGHDIRLERPARRIVSLSPHTTELLYAAGAGAYVVGVSSHSDYPPAARQVASIGNTEAVDIEKILMLKPDLVVAWHSGNAAVQLQRLRAFGLPVFESEPADYATIASSLERLGVLSGSLAESSKAAAGFRRRWQTLERTYRARAPVSVFYQIWEQPLMTLNGRHMVSSVLRTCGGRNLFADMPQLAPGVSIESVIATDPDVILAPDDARDHAFARWRRFTKIKAVMHGNLLTVDADWLNRPGPRILDATGQVCMLLDTVRRRSAARSKPP